MTCSRRIVGILRSFSIACLVLGIALVVCRDATAQIKPAPVNPPAQPTPRIPFQALPQKPRPVVPAPGDAPADNPPAGNVAAPLAAQVAPDLQDLVRAVESSVVIIEVPGQGMGSGFVIDAEGTIVTNYHVIEGARTAKVKFLNKKTYTVAGFIEVQPTRDIALLVMRGLSGEPFTALPLAVKEPGKGERVVAFGAPKGLGGSIADGIVSSVRDGKDIRDVILKTTGQDLYTKMLGYDVGVTWIQTTAPISGGNSGGPLVNLRGEVVGMNTWSRPDGQNLNFALAASEISKIVSLSKRPGIPAALRPLSDLPKPRPGAIAGDSGQRTLEYWTNLHAIHQLRKEHEQRVSVPSKTANAARWESYYKNCAEVMAEQAKLIKEMPIDQVDTDLVVLATREAQNAESISIAFDAGARSVKSRLKSVMSDASNLLARCVRDDRSIRSSYDILRIALNKKYGLEFSYEAKEKEAEPENVAAEDAAANETKAKSLLSNAKRLIKIKPDEARNWLQKVITTHPTSAAAKEAETLLKDLPAPVE